MSEDNRNNTQDEQEEITPPPIRMEYSTKRKEDNEKVNNGEK